MNRLLTIAAIIIGFVGLAHAGDMKHPSLPPAVHAGEPCVFGQVACAGGGGGGGGSGVINVTLPPYNAKGDNSADDYAAIQLAIDKSAGLSALPTAANFFGGSSNAVYLPHPPNCYKISQPLRAYTHDFKMSGENHSQLCTTFYGPSYIQTSINKTGTITYAPNLVTGPGQGIVQAGGASYFFNVPFFNANYNHGMAVSFASGFTIEGFYKPSAGSGPIVCSQIAYPGNFNGNGLFCLNNSGTAVSATVETSGGLVSLSACSNFAEGQTYQYAITWDGSNYRLRQGIPGSSFAICDTEASSNPPIQVLTEQVTFPTAVPSAWLSNDNQVSAAPGTIASWRFSTIDRYGSGSFNAATADLPYDANTFYVTYFENIQDTSILKGYTGANGTPVYSPSTGYNIGYVDNANVSDIEFCANGMSDGPFIAGANNSIWNNNQCSNAYANQINLFGNDYLSTLSNFNGFGGNSGIVEGAAWNDSHGINNQSDGTEACFVRAGGGGEEDHPYCVDRGGLIYGWLSMSGTDGGVITHLTIGEEAGNTGLVAPMWLQNPGPFVFLDATIPTLNSIPNLTIDGGGIGPIFKGSTFIGSSAPELIHYINGTPTSRATFENVTIPSGVPVSDTPQYVKVNGTSFVTFAQLTSITCPTAGLAPDGATGWLVSNATICTTGSLITSSPGTTYCSAICDNSATGHKWVH